MNTHALLIVAALAAAPVIAFSACGGERAASHNVGGIEQGRPTPDPKPAPEPRPVPEPKPGPTDTGDPPPPTSQPR